MGGGIDADQRRIDAEVIRRRIAPTLACVIIIVRGATALALLDEAASTVVIAVATLFHATDSIVEVGRDKHIYHVVALAQNVVGTSSHEHARTIACGLQNRIALKLEKAVVGKFASIDVPHRKRAASTGQQRAEKAFFLVVFFKEMLRKTTLAGCNRQQFLVVERTAEFLGQFLCNFAASRADLSSNRDNHIFLVDS